MLHLRRYVQGRLQLKDHEDMPVSEYKDCLHDMWLSAKEECVFDMLLIEATLPFFYALWCNETPIRVAVRDTKKKDICLYSPSR